MPIAFSCAPVRTKKRCCSRWVRGRAQVQTRPRQRRQRLPRVGQMRDVVTHTAGLTNVAGAATEVAPPLSAGRSSRSRGPVRIELFDDEQRRLHGIAEAGHPVLIGHVGRLMHTAGSPTVTDEASFRAYWNSAAGKAAQQMLDLELVPAAIHGEYDYIVWRGRKGKVHRGGTAENPPADYGRNAFAALQSTLDAHRVQGRGNVRVATRKMAGRTVGGGAHWPQTAEKTWTEKILPTLLPGKTKTAAPGEHFAIVNHVFGGDPFGGVTGDPGSRHHQDWVVRRLRALADGGAIELGVHKLTEPDATPQKQPRHERKEKRKADSQQAMDVLAGTRGKNMSRSDTDVLKRALEGQR